jgi:uncharacterized membrane protein YdcZ (DUF606 family)
MKWILIIVGVLLMLLGVIWVLQGTHVLTQGVMAGHMRWTFIGGMVFLLGAVLVRVGASRKKSTPAA